MKKTTFLTKAAALLIVALFSLTGARAAATLTVYDGSTTNSVVPIYGSNLGYYVSWRDYVEHYTKSQFIIPAAKLAGMSGGDITVITFYAQQEYLTWYGDAEFEVYLSEVQDATISSLKNWNTLTSVYSGGLGIGSHMMTIPLDAPFKYNGGNLLVGIRQTNLGTNASESTWYGETVTGASMGGYGNNANNTSGTISQQNFIPKTTFTFLPGHTPTNVTVSNITTTTADVSWTGNADTYIVKYRRQREGFFEDFSSRIPSTWTIHTNGEKPNTEGWVWTDAWGEGAAASYSWTEGNHSYHADNWLVSPAVELGGTLRFDVKTAQWHDKYEVLLSTTGVAEADFGIVLQEMAPGITGKVDIDLSDYSGEGHIAFHHVDYDQWYVDIDNFEVTPGHDWTVLPEQSAKSVQLTSLIPGAKYELVIIGMKNGYEAHSPNTVFTTVDGPIQVTIGSFGYTSLYFGDRALTIPTGVTAYTYKVNNAGEFVVSRTYPAGNILPKGTAVVLQGAPGTYSFARSNQTGQVDNNNILRGTDVKLQTTGGKYYYAFTTKDGANPGFYWRNPGGKPFKNNPNKAYLALDEKITQYPSNDAGVKSFFLLPEDDPTGIDNVNDNLNLNANLRSALPLCTFRSKNGNGNE